MTNYTEVREKHRKMVKTALTPKTKDEWCAHCGPWSAWPCDTIALLDRIERLEGATTAIRDCLVVRGGGWQIQRGEEFWGSIAEAVDLAPREALAGKEEPNG